ncbi:MAG: hypothetical protein ACLUQ6_01840 [Alistipes onderdonkii]
MLFKDFTVNQNLNLNIRGGSQKVNYFLNAAVSNENGIIADLDQNLYDVKMNHQKYIFQSNVNAKITKTTTVGIKVNAQLEYNTRPNEDIGNLFYYSMRANPVRFPATLPAEEGDTFVRYGNNASWDTGTTDLNPLAKLASGYGKRYYSYVTTAFTLYQNPDMVTKGLSANFMASFYNYTYSATYRSATPYYFKVEDESSLNPDGTANLVTNSIGDTGTTYLTSTDGNGGHRRLCAAILAELRPEIRQTRRGRHVRLPHERKEKQYRRNERIESAAISRTGYGRSCDIWVRRPLPVRGEFRLQWFGELRSRQTLGLLPFGRCGMGHLE